MRGAVEPLEDRRLLSGLTIGDAAIMEGNAGTSVMAFTVTLSPASAQPVTVHYATADGWARVADYGAASGDLTFAPGQTSRTISVTVKGDTEVEGDETILVNLSNAVGASVADWQAVGTIVDDDLPILQFSAATYTANEKDGSVTINITRTGGLTGSVSVYCTVEAETAVEGIDYSPPADKVVFGDGESTKALRVMLTDDLWIEADETMRLTLSMPGEGAVLGPVAAAVVKIVDDDANPSDFVAPAAKLAKVAAAKAGAKKHTIKVTFTDDSPIDVTTLGAGDVCIKGPRKFRAYPALVSQTSENNGRQVVATYALVPPGRKWDSRDSGAYSVWLMGSQVYDSRGNVAPAKKLGAFSVKLVRKSRAELGRTVAASASPVVSPQEQMPVEVWPFGAEEAIRGRVRGELLR